tara:strand:+ start:87 stop:269 length:183 start_codon:yes stop_codon:yes gene_type:complete
MARTSRAQRHRRRESVLALVSQGKGFSDVVTTQMSQWGPPPWSELQWVKLRNVIELAKDN